MSSGAPTASPAAASVQNGPAVDLDLQAVEGIPRDTLVALLKRKNKEAKACQAKLDKLEERYVKVVRFNRILMEDRSSFQRLCGELLPESGGVFEEAAAQESPVNLDALLRGLAAWRGAFDAATEDRRVFQQFIELVFPGDEAVAQVFGGPGLGSGAFDALQQRWVALEDLHNQSIASINAMAREQVMGRAREFEEAVAARQESERRLEEMREQLTQVAREKAQMLKHRIQGGGATELGGEAKPEGGPPSSLAGIGHAADAGLDAAADDRLRQIKELRAACDAAERREQQARDASERQQRDLQAALEVQQSEVSRLRREMDAARDEAERHRMQARELVGQKDAVLERLQQRLTELEDELSSNAFITQCAEQQAGRDAEVKAKQKQVEQLNQTITEVQKLLGLSYSQERVLKARIRELEQSQGRGHVAGDYLKHVVLKYVQYAQVGDMKAQTLVPVICTLLKLSPEECRSIEAPAIPQPLLIINQAVGGAATWLRGAPAGDAPPAPDPLGDG